MQPQRSNYFTIFWIQEGRGVFCADSGEHPFDAGSLLFLVPYQSFRLVPEAAMLGTTLQFHANFLCIETHHEEVGCNGVLFNDAYGVPCVKLIPPDGAELGRLLAEMQAELEERGLAHSEVLLSYLKIFLVRTTRLKLAQQQCQPADRAPDLLLELRQHVEAHFRAEHSPAFYAAKLHLAPKSLAHLVRRHLNKTLTELIRERIARQAKWEMLHTRKPVKQVAAELGFRDIFYFSRFFKRATGCSPTFFRDFETTIREGRNLSMP